VFSHVMVGADDVEASKRKGVLAVAAPPYINEQARRAVDLAHRHERTTWFLALVV